MYKVIPQFAGQFGGKENARCIGRSIGLNFHQFKHKFCKEIGNWKEIGTVNRMKRFNGGRFIGVQQY